ncbi:MAG TPA: hypothetical protein VIX20_14750 [Ktedonobacteraceae bacterium]
MQDQYPILQDGPQTSPNFAQQLGQQLQAFLFSLLVWLNASRQGLR